MLPPASACPWTRRKPSPSLSSLMKRFTSARQICLRPPAQAVRPSSAKSPMPRPAEGSTSSELALFGGGDAQTPASYRAKRSVCRFACLSPPWPFCSASEPWALNVFPFFFFLACRGNFELTYQRRVGANTDPDFFEFAFSSKHFPPDGANRRHYRNSLYRRAYRSDSLGDGRKSGEPCRANSQRTLPKISLTCHYGSMTSSPSTARSRPL